jgi:hypothetical protein
MAGKATTKLPREVVKLIAETWPDRLVEQFDTSESYFHEWEDGIGGALRRIPGVASFWETPDPSERYRDFDDDDFGVDDGSDQFQSYHVYFLSPRGTEFRSAVETESYADPEFDEDSEDMDEDPEDFEPEEITVSGERSEGYAVGISLAAPVAAISWSSMATFEDGSFDCPDIATAGSGEPYEDEGDEPDEAPLSEEAQRKKERLRVAIVAVLEKYKIKLLDDATLQMRVPGLRADEEVFIDKHVRVFDAFFFRGV